MLDIKPRYKIEIGNPSTFNLVLAGCGGTGSFLALHLARLAYHAREKDIWLYFCDHDTVEPQNIGRQNFVPAEIGRNKAVTLAQRYSRAFGLRIDYYPRCFEAGIVPRERDALTLIIGAVDNAAARQSLDATARDAGCWWLDTGNHEHAGQVLVGNGDADHPVIDGGVCVSTPFPSVQHPELLTPAPVLPAPESCAELLARDAQSLMINQAMATWAAQYVYRLIVTRDLDVYATYVDLQRGSARSEAITDA